MPSNPMEAHGKKYFWGPGALHALAAVKECREKHLTIMLPPIVLELPLADGDFLQVAP